MCEDGSKRRAWPIALCDEARQMLPCCHKWIELATEDGATKFLIHLSRNNRKDIFYPTSPFFGATLGGEPAAPSHSKLDCVHDASVLTTMKSLCDLTAVWALKRERLQLVIHFEVSRRHLGFFIFVFVALFFAHPFAAFATYSKVSAFLEDEGRWSLQTHDAI
jgi:hypothetical protein